MYHNVISNRRIEFSHSYDLNDIEVLHREPNDFKRILAELFFIRRKQKRCINVITETHHMLSYCLIT